MNNTNMNKAFQLLNLDIKVPEKLLEDLRYKMSNYGTFEKQLKSKDLFNYIKTSKNYEIFKEYKNNDEHKNNYKYFSHGIRHADNVTIFAYYIAEKERYSERDIRLILEAARNHDIGRTNDWEEGNHGFAGAEKYSKDTLKDNELQIVKFLIAAHDLPRVDDVKKLAQTTFKDSVEKIEKLFNMANIIRDADALDRTRFPIIIDSYINPRYLIHNCAKEIIEVAQILNYRENEIR